MPTQKALGGLAQFEVKRKGKKNIRRYPGLKSTHNTSQNITTYHNIIPIHTVPYCAIKYLGQAHC
jgi:hypothetical protein